MSDILLAKPVLPEGFIDLSVGEAHIIKDAFLKTFGIDNNLQISFTKDLYEYPHAEGYGPLVSLLEEKHNAPVIITNGAKQALGAVFYALKKIGKSKIGMKVPYWPLLKPLMEAHGMTCSLSNPDVVNKEFDSYLLLAPNNPDGECASQGELKQIEWKLRDLDIPLIHDAVYYSNIYLPYSHMLKQLGDVQIFSMSKYFGLSGLRVGYTVCYNKAFYKYIQEYMEMMTVGVSTISQKLIYDVLDKARKDLWLEKLFISKAKYAVEQSKSIFKNVRKDVLEIPDDFENTYGMFAFLKHNNVDFEKAKLKVVDGALFGKEGFVRINLALPPDTLKEVVKRFNSQLPPAQGWWLADNLSISTIG